MTTATANVDVLRQGWGDAVAALAPSVADLPLLIERRIDEAVRQNKLDERALLLVVDEAARVAARAIGGDTARLLTRRLQRAVYEYLLSQDAASPEEIETMKAAALSGHPAAGPMIGVEEVADLAGRNATSAAADGVDLPAAPEQRRGRFMIFRRGGRPQAAVPDDDVPDEVPEAKAPEDESVEAVSPEVATPAVDPAAEVTAAQPEPEVTAAQPEPEVTAPEPEPEGAAPEPEPEGAVASEPEPEGAVASEPAASQPEVTAAEPAPLVMAPEPEPEMTAAPEPEAAEPEATTPEAEPAAATQPETAEPAATAPEPEPAVAAEPETAPSSVPEPPAVAGPEPPAEPAPMPEPPPALVEFVMAPRDGFHLTEFSDLLRPAAAEDAGKVVILDEPAAPKRNGGASPGHRDKPKSGASNAKGWKIREIRQRLASDPAPDGEGDTRWETIVEPDAEELGEKNQRFENDPQVIEARRQINDRLRRRRCDEAASLLQRLAMDVGGRPVAELALDAGDRCRALGKSNAALSCYLAASRADPVHEVPLLRLADICLDDKDIDLAVSYLERVARIHRLAGEHKRALRLYRKIATIAPYRDDIMSMLMRAQATGRFDD